MAKTFHIFLPEHLNPHLMTDDASRSFPLEAQLTEKDYHHLVHVKRLSDQDQLFAFDPKGGGYRASLEKQKESYSVKLHEPLAADRLPVADQNQSTHQVAVFQAPPKGGKLDRLIKPLSELGATRLIPMITERTIVQKTPEAWQKKTLRFRELAKESAKQCLRTTPLEIEAPLSFEQVLNRIEALDLGLVMTPEAQGAWGRLELQQYFDYYATRQEVLSAGPTRVGILVGPEGGLTPDEARKARNRGWQFWHLNTPVLRSETAAPSALAILQFILN